MTFRLPTFLAASLFLASTAHASTPTTSDQARDLFHDMLPSQSISLAAPATGSPTTSDQARDLAHLMVPAGSSKLALTFTGNPTTSDEARAIAGSRLQ